MVTLNYFFSFLFNVFVSRACFNEFLFLLDLAWVNKVLYCIFACALIALQVVRKSSPSSRPQFYSFYSVYDGLENKLTRAQLLGLAKSVYS